MNPVRGILLNLCSVLLFSIMAALIKSTAPQIPPGQAVFFRSFFALPVILIWIASRGSLREGLRVSDPVNHFWRGLVGTTSMALGFGALGLLPLPEVTAIGFTAPLLTVIFAAMFLGERIRLFRLSAVGIGLIGVVVILYPRLTFLGTGGAQTLATLGAILALGSAVFRALAHVYIRKLVQTDKTSAIVFFFSLTASMLSLLTIPFGWAMPTAQEAAFLVGAGIIGGIAQIFLTSGYRFAEASVLAPFDYVSMIFSILIGWFIFTEAPTTVMLAGATLIIGGGIAIILRERYLGVKRSKGRSTLTPEG